MSTSIWRPPQWQSGTLYIITVPATTSAESKTYILTPLRVAHELVLRRTEHPVQSGAAITDHAYVMPAKLIMEIGVSDSMDTYASGMWGGSSSSTSVNAFDALRELVRQRVLITVQTRLQSYSNMIVESVAAEETNRTVASGRFHVVFGELFIASTQVVAAATARSDTLSEAGKGTITAKPTSLQVDKQFVNFLKSLTPSTAIGSGTATSNANCHLSVSQVKGGG